MSSNESHWQPVRLPSPAQAWWALLVVTLALILSHADRQVLNLTIDPIRHDLKISDTQISLVQGMAFALFYVVAGLPIGRAVDVFPRRYVLVIGVLTWSLATLASGVAASFGQLFLSRTFIGAGEATLMPAACSLLADVFPPSQRGTAIGVFLFGTAIGAAVGNLIGGLVLHAVAAGAFAAIPGLGGLAAWRVLFLILGGPGVVVALFVLTIHEPKRVRQPGVPRAPLSRVIAGFRERASVLLPIYAALAATAISSIAVFAWAPTMISRRMGVPLSDIGAAIGVIGIVTGILGAVGGGVLSDLLAKRRGPAARQSMAAGISLIAVAGAFAGMATEPWQAYLGVALTCFATSVTGTVAVTGIQDVASDEIRGLAASLISAATVLLGVGLGPTLVALATQHLFHADAAVGWAMTVVAVPTSLLATLSLWLASRAMRSDGELSPERYLSLKSVSPPA